MDDYESLSHTKWECKYHVVFIPKYRRKTLYGELRRHLGKCFANWRYYPFEYKEEFERIGFHSLRQRPRVCSPTSANTPSVAREDVRGLQHIILSASAAAAVGLVGNAVASSTNPQPPGRSGPRSAAVRLSLQPSAC